MSSKHAIKVIAGVTSIIVLVSLEAKLLLWQAAVRSYCKGVYVRPQNDSRPSVSIAVKRGDILGLRASNEGLLVQALRE